jgi:tetratricopeptide (TPR) repeat protein
VLTVAAAVSAQTPRQPPLIDLIALYDQGRHDEAIRQAAAIEDLGPLRLRFVQEVPLWVRADLAHIERRRAAAAAFLLELTHARLESDWGRFIDLIEFVCTDLRLAQQSTPFERAWHQASIALASRARARLWLLGEYPLLPHQPPRKRPPPKVDNPSPRHLMHALERFPEDAPLRLAQIVAWTWGRDQEPIRNLRRDGDRVVVPFRSAPPQREAIISLTPLVEDPVVGAEALIRIGHIHMSMGDYASARDAFERAQHQASTQPIRYLAFFSAGRALEGLARPDEAMKRYAAALEVIPGAESASVALASLQFIHDDRESAVSLVRRTFSGTSVVTDPGRLVGYGSFMHWPELRAALRAALPQ